MPPRRPEREAVVERAAGGGTFGGLRGYTASRGSSDTGLVQFRGPQRERAGDLRQRRTGTAGS